MGFESSGVLVSVGQGLELFPFQVPFMHRCSGPAQISCVGGCSRWLSDWYTNMLSGDFAGRFSILELAFVKPVAGARISSRSFAA